ncbi:MAG TPA: hypothetical protein VEC17_00905, partial [Candidatus Binatia bacterium]|nr:hypothetical protein [Candidatus Binatia bacterium]
MPKLIKLLKNEQLVDVIKRIKNLKGDEAVFEIPVGAAIFKNAHNLSLIKKSAAALDKTIIIRTDDPEGKSLVAKAGLLVDDGQEFVKPEVKARTTKKVKFADIGASTMPRPAAAEAFEEPAEKPILRSNKTTKPVDTSFVPAISKIPRISSAFSRFFVLGVIVIVLIAFGLFILVPQANITVYARSEPITRDMEISVDRETRSINSSRLTIPGETVNRELSHTKNFPTTGVRLSGTKATGSVQLYNFTKNTLTLRAATTTLIVDGKKYSFARDVTGLRPTARIGTGQQQEIDSSSLIAPVPIVAQEVGANFNIGSKVRMEIQNAALGQADVYGETSTALTGGSSTETKILSQQDLDNATKA